MNDWLFYTLLLCYILQGNLPSQEEARQRRGWHKEHNWESSWSWRCPWPKQISWVFEASLDKGNKSRLSRLYIRKSVQSNVPPGQYGYSAPSFGQNSVKLWNAVEANNAGDKEVGNHHHLERIHFSWLGHFKLSECQNFDSVKLCNSKRRPLWQRQPPPG